MIFYIMRGSGVERVRERKNKNQNILCIYYKLYILYIPYEECDHYVINKLN